MSTRATSPQLDKKKLSERIILFYSHLNEEKWDKCFNLVDPILRDNGDVSFETYSSSLASFFAAHGPIENVAVTDLKLYVNVHNNKHDDRDFAYGTATWEDRTHAQHISHERWVRADDGRWYSRMAGMV